MALVCAVSLSRARAERVRPAVDRDNARRRRFVAERLMALHDSALADAPLRALALRALCAAAAAPELAADLVLRAGARPCRARA